jgi:hypothetical protein
MASPDAVVSSNRGAEQVQGGRDVVHATVPDHSDGACEERDRMSTPLSQSSGIYMSDSCLKHS